MLEHRTLLAALDDFEVTLAAQTIGDPTAAAVRDQHVALLAAEPGHAALGALLTPLAWFGSVGGDEATLVHDIAGCWAEGLRLYDALTDFRRSLQSLLDHGTSASAQAVAELNAAGNALRTLAPQVQGLLAELHGLRGRVASLEHLPRHPRQEDRPIQEWSWNDILLARRTEALVRGLLDLSAGGKGEAVALGACAAYGGQVSGSMYLAQTVGGPRRAHRVRDRLGRNAVGAWIAAHRPGLPGFSQLADLLDATFAAGLDTETQDLLSDALTDAFPLGTLPPAPRDVDAALTRMVAHLRDLAVIRTPKPPAPLSDAIATALFGDPATPYIPTLDDQTSLTESGGTPGVPGSGAGVQILSAGDDGPAHQEEPDSTEVKCGAFWEALGLSLLFLLGGWFACMLRWADGDRCPLWDQAGADWSAAFDNGVYVGGEVDTDWGSQMLTAAGAAAIAQRPEVLQLAGDLFTLQSTMWEGFQKAADFLALGGVIYPDGMLDRWRYRQFTAIPLIDHGLWPQLPDDGERFDLYPQTGVEEPAGHTPFRSNAAPSAIFTGIGGGGQLSAASVSLPLWWDAVTGAGASQNLDLDADRGWRHPCWQTGGSIGDQPIDVVVLGYADV